MGEVVKMPHRFFTDGTYSRKGPFPERPNRTAKLVAQCDYGSGPGGGDYRSYYLSRDRYGDFTLWRVMHDYDTGKPDYCHLGFGGPGRGLDPKEAASRLMEDCIVDEMTNDWGEVGEAPSVSPWYSPLLDGREIWEIAEKALKRRAG